MPNQMSLGLKLWAKFYVLKYDIESFLTKEVKPGDDIPVGYGFGSYNLNKNTLKVHPLGLNLIVSGAIAFYYAVVQGFKSRSQSYLYKTAFGQGQLQGQQIGYFKGYSDSKMDNIHAYAPQMSTKGAIAKQEALEKAAAAEALPVS